MHKELVNNCNKQYILDSHIQIWILSQPPILRHWANGLPTVDLQCCQIYVSFSRLYLSLCIISAKDFPDNCQRVSHHSKNQSPILLLSPPHFISLSFFPPLSTHPPLPESLGAKHWDNSCQGPRDSEEGGKRGQTIKRAGIQRYSWKRTPTRKYWKKERGWNLDSEEMITHAPLCTNFVACCVVELLCTCVTKITLWRCP